MNYLLPFWNYQISAGVTLLTGVLLLWQYAGAKGIVGHISPVGVGAPSQRFCRVYEQGDGS
jgi:hypothetical protein